MHLTRYLDLIARIGYSGVKSKELVFSLMREWGVSRRQVYYYISKMKKEGLLRVRRYKDGKYVEPTPKLKAWLVRVEEGYPKHFLRHYSR